MSEKLDWVFEGVDKFSGPVGGMTGGLVKFAFGMNQAGEALSGLLEGLERVGEMGFEFAKFGLEALSFKEKTLIGYETILKSKDEANKLFNQAVQMSEFTPFSAKDVNTGFAKLLSQGFSAKEVPIVLQAVMDAGSMGKSEAESKEMMDSIMNHFGHMMQNFDPAKGFAPAQGRQLTWMFQQIAQSGISAQSYWENLGKDLGVTGVEAHNMVEHGLVPAKTAMLAFIDTTAQLSGHAGPGFTAVKMGSQTLAGLFVTLKSRAEEAFLMMGQGGIDSVPGINTLKDAMQNVADATNTMIEGPGKRLQDAFERMFGGALLAIFGDVAGPGGLGMVEGGMDKLAKWMNTVDWVGLFTEIKNVIVTVGRAAWGFVSSFLAGLTPLIVVVRALFGIFSSGGGADAFVTMGKVVAFLVGGLLGLAVIITMLMSPIFMIIAGIVAWTSAIYSLFDVDWAYIPEQLGQLWTAIAGWFSEKWGQFKQWGVDMIDGLIEGILGSAARLTDAIGGVVSGMTGSFTSLLGIHSPSTLFAEYGGYTAEGFQLGVEGGTDDATAAVNRLAGGQPTASGGGGASGGGFSVTFAEGAIKIDGTGMDEETLARRLRSELVSAMATVFEGLSTEGGMAGEPV